MRARTRLELMLLLYMLSSGWGNSLNFGLDERSYLQRHELKNFSIGVKNSLVSTTVIAETDGPLLEKNREKKV